MAVGSIRFMAVGDVMLGDPPEPMAPFAQILPTLKQADVLFGQNETSYSERGEPVPQARGKVRFHPRNIPALAEAGFDVMSVCGNHAVDYGHMALLDTIDGLRAAGVKAVGAGRDADDARGHVIVEKKGLKLAVLAYGPASDKSYNADTGRPGNVPLAVYTYYHEAEPDFPGAKPTIFTFPDPTHVAKMRADIEAARSEADAVVVSFHWGLPFAPVTLADYESELGKIAIDCGADLVVGHHQHLIKAVETYKGKVIFHGMNHLLMWLKLPKSHYDSPKAKLMRERHGDDYLQAYNPDSANPFPRDSNLTMIVSADFGPDGVGEVGFIPCVIDPVTSVPRRTYPGDGDFEKVLEFTRHATEQAGMSTVFEVKGDMVVVRT